MLSTKYRQRLEFICDRIAKGEEVQLADMIWASKLAKANRSAGEMLRKARRIAKNPDMPKGGLDEFMMNMDIGDEDAFSGNPDDLTEWFHHEKTDDWRQRD